MMATFGTFATWAEVLAHVTADRPIWYQAPLDWRPVRVECHLVRNGRAVRVVPASTDVDPFTADAGHLDRFKYALQPAGRPTRRCEVCSVDTTADSGRCTNGRCTACHTKHCTGHGTENHGRGTAGRPAGDR